jgi:RNA polymerase sigma factor (TIGR02999 family)
MSGEVTRLLACWSEGDSTATERLLPLIYDELRRLGRSFFRSGSHVILQPTALVHEAFIKLAGNDDISVNNRSQFYALAAKVMREILVDHFRRESSAKRGGSMILLPLDESASASSNADRSIDMLTLDAALQRLSELKPRYTQIIELKFFAGLTIEECSQVLSVSHATVEREWTFARSWLRRELTQ